MQVRPLPPCPALELYEAQAKDLLLASTPTLADAQLFIAAMHGFESWPVFEKQIKALSNGDSPEAAFEVAADAIVSGDMQTLRHRIQQNPQLVAARSMRTHHATLLHYVAANGVEDYRQKSPKNIVEIAAFLLDSGADVHAEMNAYGGRCTVLALTATSVHPQRAGVQEPLLQFLLDHGAASDTAGAGGNGHNAVEACLWNGQGRAAKFLGSRGAQLNVETAAGTGDLAAVISGLSSATSAQLQRGFLWACAYGYPDVVEFLLNRGADLSGQGGTNQTALHWAVIAGNLSMIQLLLKRGARLEARNQYGGTALGQAEWCYEHGDSGARFIPVIETLLAAGAKIEDGWQDWLERQKVRPADETSRLAELYRRHASPPR